MFSVFPLYSHGFLLIPFCVSEKGSLCVSVTATGHNQKLWMMVGLVLLCRRWVDATVQNLDRNSIVCSNSLTGIVCCRRLAVLRHLDCFYFCACVSASVCVEPVCFSCSQCFSLTALTTTWCRDVPLTDRHVTPTVQSQVLFCGCPHSSNPRAATPEAVMVEMNLKLSMSHSS